MGEYPTDAPFANALRTSLFPIIIMASRSLAHSGERRKMVKVFWMPSCCSIVNVISVPPSPRFSVANRDTPGALMYRIGYELKSGWQIWLLQRYLLSFGNAKYVNPIYRPMKGGELLPTRSPDVRRPKPPRLSTYDFATVLCPYEISL